MRDRVTKTEIDPDTDEYQDKISTLSIMFSGIMHRMYDSILPYELDVGDRMIILVEMVLIDIKKLEEQTAVPEEDLLAMFEESLDIYADTVIRGEPEDPDAD